MGKRVRNSHDVFVEWWNETGRIIMADGFGKLRFKKWTYSPKQIRAAELAFLWGYNLRAKEEKAAIKRAKKKGTNQ